MGSSSSNSSSGSCSSSIGKRNNNSSSSSSSADRSTHYMFRSLLTPIATITWTKNRPNLEVHGNIWVEVQNQLKQQISKLRNLKTKSKNWLIFKNPPKKKKKKKKKK